MDDEPVAIGESTPLKIERVNNYLGGDSGVDWQEADKIQQFALKETTKLCNHILYVVVSYAVTKAMRFNIFVLYARDFYDDTALISVFVYLNYVFCAIFSLIFGVAGNQWRFDVLIFIATLMDVITFWLEATTNNFWVLVIAYAVGGQPFLGIGLAWNIKMLPTYDNKQFRTRVSQSYYIGVITGPIIGGILSSVFSYRFVFYGAAVISIILTMLVVKWFWNIESKILEMQMEMTPIYNMIDDNPPMDISEVNTPKWAVSDHHRFPICLKNGIRNGNHNNGSWDESSDIKKYEMGLVVGLMIVAGCLVSTEGMVGVYYVAYMQDFFGINTLISTSQIATFAIGFASGTQYIKYRARMNDRDNNIRQDEGKRDIYYDFTNEFMLTAVTCSVVSIVFSFVIMPLDVWNDNLDRNGLIAKFWVALYIYGFMFACSFHSVEMMSVELIPKSIASSVSGAKSVCRFFMLGTACFFVGILWDYSYNWLWYVQSCVQVGAAFILLIIVASEMFVKEL